MKKNITIILLVILLLILAWMAFPPDTPRTSARQHHFAIGVSASGDVTCTYPQVLHTSYQGNEVAHELPRPETNPIIMTFSDIQTGMAKIKFIDATQTISEVPVVKVMDTPDKLIFLEGAGDPYMTLHTIYKNIGVSIYAKEMSFLGTPVGTIAMGTCINS